MKNTSLFICIYSLFSHDKMTIIYIIQNKLLFTTKDIVNYKL